MLKKRARARLLFLAGALVLALASPARAIESSSAHYRNTRSSLDNGGVRKTATDYRADDAAGEVSASTGTSSSYTRRDGLMGDDFYPARIGDLSGSTPGAGALNLQWTAPGNDGDDAGTTVKTYVVRYSTDSAQSPALSDAKFEAAASLTPPAPLVKGSLQTVGYTGLIQGVTYYVAVKAVEADGLRGVLSNGATVFIGGGAPTGVSLAGVWLSSAALTYATVGADGYAVDASTDSQFRGVVRSSGSLAQANVLAPQGLDPNTTYYLRAGALWGQTTFYSATVISTSTLAQPVSGTTIYSIHVTSMDVNWIPLPSAPPQASSNSASGYVLEVSSRSDFAPLWTSSTSWSVVQSTLTPGGLLGGVTYYFRVGSLNWDGAPNYATAVSTLMPIQLGVQMTTHTVALGSTPMNATVVVTTSIAVSNTGNVYETYRLRATTTTAGSPWQIGVAQGQDTYEAWAVLNSTQPAAIDFGAASQLQDAEQACAASAFTMGHQGCVQVAPGGSGLLWVKVATPLTTSTSAGQSIAVTARAVKDP